MKIQIAAQKTWDLISSPIPPGELWRRTGHILNGIATSVAILFGMVLTLLNLDELTGDWIRRCFMLAISAGILTRDLRPIMAHLVAWYFVHLSVCMMRAVYMASNKEYGTAYFEIFTFAAIALSVSTLCASSHKIKSTGELVIEADETASRRTDVWLRTIEYAILLAPSIGFLVLVYSQLEKQLERSQNALMLAVAVLANVAIVGYEVITRFGALPVLGLTLLISPVARVVAVQAVPADSAPSKTAGWHRMFKQK